MRDEITQEFGNPLSPMLEAAAYEALWDENSASAKKISEKVLQHNRQSNLSDLISAETLEKYVLLLRTVIARSNEQFGVQFMGDADYPSKLLDAKYPVPLLYYRGAWDLVFSPSVAVVGTREPSSEGIKRTQKLVRSLVTDGYTIISGLAKGIDTVAHETALEVLGKTIAVIGTSIKEYYPKENKSLQDKIALEHLLISQVPIIRSSKQNYQTNRFFFPERNKTMSALSLGTVIVEAGNTSGSLIQAQAALQQGRKLFILDSCFHNKELSWPEKFLRQGAIRVTDYQDIHVALHH